MPNARALAGLPLLASLFACLHLPPTPDDAATAASAPNASAEVIAVAALAELDRGHGPAAKALLARIADRQTPRAALARLLSCERDLDVPCELDAAAALLAGWPRSPAAPLAAEALRKIAGDSTTLDEKLLTLLPQLLADHAAPLDLESQHLLRDALAAILVDRADYAAAQKLRAEQGVLQAWEIVGPLSAYHYLEFDTPLGPEKEPEAPSFAAPWGLQPWRLLRLGNGQLPLGHGLERSEVTLGDGQSRAPTGDILYLKTQVTAAGGGIYLREESSASLRIFLDGKLVASIEHFRKLAPRASWFAIDAADGPHTLLVKAAVGDASRTARFEALPRTAVGPLPLTAQALIAALGGQAGPYLGRSLAARVLAPLDPHAALQLLGPSATEGAPALGTLGLSARAELWSGLGTLDDEEARGRTQADLDAWIEADPDSVQARVRRAQLLQELNRFALAARDLEVALGAGETPELLVTKARMLLAHDAAPLSAAFLARALKLDPGNCLALDLQLSADDAANALAHAAELSRAYAACPGGQQALAERRSRVEGPAPLAEYWRNRLTRSPGDPEAALQLADNLYALGDSAGALAALEQRLQSWPEDGSALRHRAVLQDLDGHGLTPSAAWQAVLNGDAADLTLRRALALLAGKAEPLEELMPPVAEVLAQPRWVGPGRPPSATLLDSGAAWLHADGTVTERVRTVETPLDETALSALGELELPGGAALLALRTHKRDGRVLDADAQVGGEKHTVSAPSLEVGDTLEIDYLMSNPPPRRAGGSVADAFYFLATDSSLRRSIYQVRTEGPAELDAHRIEAPKTVNGTITVERTKVPAVAEEPSTPPQNEFFPWVQVGTGSTAETLARSVADQLLDKVTVEEGLIVLLKQLPESAKRSLDDRVRAEALWKLLCDKLRAEGGALSIPASEVVGQGSGNLLFPMKAALDFLGIPSSVVLVAGPAQSHEPHRFARLGEYADVLLRIEPRDGSPIFLAAGLREAPFDALPPNLCGARALVLPNGDGPGATISLPECPEKADQWQAKNDHLTQLDLTLGADGSAVGLGHETLFGFEATNLRGALAEVDDAQRRQGVESALAAVFQGVELTEVKFDLGAGPGASLSVSYTFKVPELASHEGGDHWSLPLRGFPAQLSQRYAQLASRTLPLLVPAGERPSLQLTLHLPAGAKLDGATPTELWLDRPFGSYLRREARAPGVVTLREKLVLPPQRVEPAQYPDFAAFADAIDRAQAERLRFELPESRVEASAPRGDRWSGL